MDLKTEEKEANKIICKFNTGFDVEEPGRLEENEDVLLFNS